MLRLFFIFFIFSLVSVASSFNEIEITQVEQDPYEETKLEGYDKQIKISEKIWQYALDNFSTISKKNNDIAERIFNFSRLAIDQDILMAGLDSLLEKTGIEVVDREALEELVEKIQNTIIHCREREEELFTSNVNLHQVAINCFNIYDYFDYIDLMFYKDLSGKDITLLVLYGFNTPYLSKFMSHINSLKCLVQLSSLLPPNEKDRKKIAKYWRQIANDLFTNRANFNSSFIIMQAFDGEVMKELKNKKFDKELAKLAGVNESSKKKYKPKAKKAKAKKAKAKKAKAKKAKAKAKKARAEVISLQKLVQVRADTFRHAIENFEDQDAEMYLEIIKPDKTTISLNLFKDWEEESIKYKEKVEENLEIETNKIEQRKIRGASSDFAPLPEIEEELVSAWHLALLYEGDPSKGFDQYSVENRALELWTLEDIQYHLSNTVEEKELRIRLFKAIVNSFLITSGMELSSALAVEDVPSRGEESLDEIKQIFSEVERNMEGFISDEKYRETFDKRLKVIELAQSMVDTVDAYLTSKFF